MRPVSKGAKKAPRDPNQALGGGQANNAPASAASLDGNSPTNMDSPAGIASGIPSMPPFFMPMPPSSSMSSNQYPEYKNESQQHPMRDTTFTFNSNESVSSSSAGGYQESPFPLAKLPLPAVDSHLHPRESFAMRQPLSTYYSVQTQHPSDDGSSKQPE
ncbi:hypothetical protein HDU77_011619 [Chytriomyces hyalinus]|nr:hypothetical protein HDU77_011619 [Chytriomyces hyalinus]